MKRIVSVPQPGVWLVSGSRHFVDYKQFEPIMNKLVILAGSPRQIIHGGCRGIDFLAERWATEQRINTRTYPAEWNEYGRKAGPVRNSLMIRKANVVIAFPTGDSKGTRDVIDKTMKFPEKMMFIFHILQVN